MNDKEYAEFEKTEEYKVWLERLEKLAADERNGWPFTEYVQQGPSKGNPDVGIFLYPTDCMEMLAATDTATIDAVVTDPPYGIKIAGKKWDDRVPGVPVWREVLRVLRPGGMLIAASHAKTYHQLATVVELAGFEIVDMLFWTYSQSFPAGKNLGDEWQSLLKRAHEPWVVARAPLAVLDVPGKRPGKTKKKKLGIQETHDLHGTAGFRVVGNGQEGMKWASNAIKAKKPDDAERSLGLDPNAIQAGTGKMSADQPNAHPTVKPISLMRRIVRLVAEPGDIVMDPFAGSGTTGMACMSEGISFLGSEMDLASFDIFQQRVEFAWHNPDKLPDAD
jgi:site-specific DNA-methyltransferase (adenine-specific)